MEIPRSKRAKREAKKRAESNRKRKTTADIVKEQEKKIAEATKEAKSLEWKKQNERKKVKRAEKLIKATQGEPLLIEGSEVDILEPLIKDEYEGDLDVIFEPNPGPQTEFLAATEREVLYGGAAGGGKSYALLADPLRYAHIPQSRKLLVRKTNDELRELVFKSKEMYPRAFKGAKWKQQESTWVFPSGAEIWFTYLDRDEDALRYQGQAFNWIGFDELTHWATPFAWNYLRSRLRTTRDDLPLSMRATTNPGNAGAWWVRELFIDAAPWNTPFWARDLDTGKILRYPPDHAKAGEPLFLRRFIPARLTDNPYLTKSGEYEANLLSLPEHQRRMLLEGDWDVVEGAAFPEFRRSVHVCEPFDIPTGWMRFRAADWGYSSPACCLWFAVDWDGTIYVYREIYVKKKNAEEFGQLILDAEYAENIRHAKLDGSCFAKRGDMGPTPGEYMNKMGLRWQMADRSPGSRKASKLEVHRRLSVRETGIPLQDNDGKTLYDEEGLPLIEKKPGLVIFSNCTNLIRTLPVLPLDKKTLEDVDTDAEDHAYDALRYGLASRPMIPKSQFMQQTMPTNSWQPVDPVFGY